jgi:hypothetical protein
MVKDTLIKWEGNDDILVQGVLKEEQKIKSLQFAIKEGINSELVEEFDIDEHLKMLKSTRK